ncbi:MAG TPA: hypothetical protein VGO11_11995, partial [Chthoniobacteraceae bacterium]|nr:hypothetical protein [Chthoniobacteraceae bacterium]
MKVLPLLCLGVLCSMAWSAEPARLSIPEVLKPETRLHAYYDYKMRADPERMERLEMQKFEDFARYFGQL